MDRQLFFMSFYWFCMSNTQDDDGKLVPFLLYLSGIIQGCPLSGSIFACDMDPLLRFFDHALSVKCASLGMASATSW